MAKSKRIVQVKPHSTATFNYAFGTNIDTADGTTLGHAAVSLLDNKTLVGVNAPKPGRAKIEKATGTTNSFYDISVKGALQTAGHRVTSPRGRRASATRFAQPVYVTMPGGWKYAWFMRKTTYTAISGELAALGIKDATSADKDLVWGCNNIKPPKATKSVPGVGGTDTYTVYIDESNLAALPTGWTPKGASGGGVTLN